MPTSERRRLIRAQKEQLEAFLDFEKQKKEVLQNSFELVIRPIMELYESPSQLPYAARRTVQYFLKKIPFDEICYASEIAADKFVSNSIDDPFRYFCGICHRRIRENNPVGYYWEETYGDSNG